MSKKKLHKTGIWLSFLCTIHCLAMPFVVTAMPFLGETFVDETAEHALIIGSIFLAAYLLVRDYRLHLNKMPLFLLAIAAFLNLIGIFAVPHTLETPFVISGALLLAAAYYINWKKSHVSCSH